MYIVISICNVYKLALHTDTIHTPIRPPPPPQVWSTQGAGLISPWLVRVGGAEALRRHPSASLSSADHTSGSLHIQETR